MSNCADDDFRFLECPSFVPVMRFGGVSRSLFCFAILSIITTHAVLFESFDQLPKNVVYDFIIVGGGTAGNTVASYLIEDETINVLVLEAGPWNTGVTEIEVPLFAPVLSQIGPYHWNYSSIPQAALGNRTLSAVRGYMLGGSSCINWSIYTRGSAEDWDRFAQVTGDDGWGWKSMLNYFKKSERWSSPVDDHNITGQFDPSVHGYKGKIGVTLSGYSRTPDALIMNASRELGGPYSFNPDMNSGYPMGIGYEQATISGGMRSSSATGYLEPVLNRPNLHVLVHAQVSRLLQTTSSEHKPAFRAVEFRDSTDALKTVSSKREIILSAGTLNTPQILLNSGIGDTQELTAVGIKPLVHLPDVGANLTEHPNLSTSWRVNDNFTYETLRRDPDLYLAEWKKSKMGPLTNPIRDRLAFGRVPFELPVGLDPSAGRNTPHFEIGFSNGLAAPPVPESGNFFSLSASTLTPSSRGSIKLSSSDPFAPPRYDPAVYMDPFGVDLLIMREAIRYAQKFMTAAAFNGYLVTPLEGLKDDMSDEELNTYIRNRSSTAFHATGTSSMSPKGAKWGVTNPDLAVKGIAGVRIIDASVMPYVISGHTSAAVYGIAERGADLVKAAHNLL